MGLFDWFRPKEPDPRAEDEARKASGPPAGSNPPGALAMVLLREPVPADGQAVLAHLRRQGALPLLPAITGVREEPGVLVARIPGGTVKMVSLPAPVPPGDLEAPVALAWHWPTARDEVAAHRGHVIVHASSTEVRPMDLWRLHTRWVAAVVATMPALGVYVGDAMMVRSRDDWLDEALATEGDGLPILLWVGINPVREEDGRVSAYTTGLSSFGIMEMEVRASARPFEEVMGRLVDAALYQVGTDKRLGDGETFGFSAEDRHLVRHLPSRFLPGTRVAVLEW
jgi:hypothetical protein